MTNHIPPHRLLPQDLVDLWEKVPEEVEEGEPPKFTWVRHRMHSTDAKHAMGIDPERWMLDKVEAADAAAVEEDAPPALHLVEDEE